MNEAWISARAGCAVVVTPDDFFLLRAGKTDLPRECAPGQLNNLRALASDIVQMEAGSFPFQDVQRTLDSEWRQESALSLLLMTLDSELSQELRAEAAGVVARLLADDEVRNVVRWRLLSTRLPDVADLEGAPISGAAADLASEAAKKRDLVEMANAAWEEIAFQLRLKRNGAAELLEYLRSACIFQGGFAALVNTLYTLDGSHFGAWIRKHFSDPGVCGFLDDWYWEAIGHILRARAAELEENPKRRPEFGALIERVSASNYGRVIRNEDWIYLADRHKLPGWAVECLPSLFIVLEVQDQSKAAILLWHFLVACMGSPGDGWQERRVLCGGHVIEVLLSREMLDWVTEIAPEFEARRIGFPYPSDAAMRGAALDSMASAEIAESARGREIAARRLREVRKRFLQGRTSSSAELGKLTESLQRMSDSLTRDEQREEGFADRISFLFKLHRQEPGFALELMHIIEKNLPHWAAKMAEESYHLQVLR